MVKTEQTMTKDGGISETSQGLTLHRAVVVDLGLPLAHSRRRFRFSLVDERRRGKLGVLYNLAGHRPAAMVSTSISWPFTVRLPKNILTPGRPFSFIVQVSAVARTPERRF